MASKPPIKDKSKPNQPKAPSNSVAPGKHPKLSAAGLSALRNQVAQTKSFVISYEKILIDLDRASDAADFWSNMVLAGQLTAGLCDGMVAVLGEMTGSFGKTAKTAYSEAKPWATIIGEWWAGNGVGGDSVAKALVGHAATAANHGAGKVGGAGGQALELSIAAKKHIGNAVIDQVNGNDYNVAENLQAGARSLGVKAIAAGGKMAGDNSAKLRLLVMKSKTLKGLDGRAGDKIGGAVGVLNELFDVAKGIGGAIAQWEIEKADNKQYFDSQKLGLMAKLKQFKAKLAQIEAELIAIEGTKNVAQWKPGQVTVPGRVAQR